jgi:hypothetical protein
MTESEQSDFKYIAVRGWAKFQEVMKNNETILAELKAPDRIEEIPIESDKPTDWPVLGTEEEL